MSRVKLTIMAALVFAVILLSLRLRSVMSELDRRAGQAKAYASELDEMATSVIAHEVTVRELSQSRDSLMMRIDSLRGALRIKRSAMKAAYVKRETLTRTDTLRLHDTLFVQGAEMDTTIGDAGFSLSLSMRAPDFITASPTFRNEIAVFVSTRRETIEPPRRFFLFRLFQKKHDVIVVDVQDMSPYCETEKQRFVKVVD